MIEGCDPRLSSVPQIGSLFPIDYALAQGHKDRAWHRVCSISMSGGDKQQTRRIQHG